jgi:glycine cleavage system H protein
MALPLENPMTIPDDRKYSKEHEWIRIDGGRGIVGITDYAQKQLGDVVYVELPEVGAALGSMQVFGTIESVKAVSELFSPVSGKVLEVNGAVVDKPEMVNSDPYGGAWLIAVELKDRAELDALMSASQYQAYLDEEAKN